MMRDGCNDQTQLKLRIKKGHSRNDQNHLKLKEEQDVIVMIEIT